MPTYTLDELIEKMEPQARLDRALMARCIDGVGLYAAGLAEGDFFSPRIAELRELTEIMAAYWGLDQGENARAEDFLRVFDERVIGAGTGNPSVTDKFQTGHNVISGLHRFGMEMVVAQGGDAIGEIMSVSALMKEIGGAWDFEPELLGELTAGLERDAWGLLPGRRVSGLTEQGYDAVKAVAYSDGQGFAIAAARPGEGLARAESPDQPEPFAVWQFRIIDGKPDFYWLKFIGPEAEAMESYRNRTADYAAAHGAKFVSMSDGWFSGKDERPSNIEVYLVNRSACGNPGEWLALPADAGKLSGLLERIGIRSTVDSYHISDIRLAFESMGKYATKYDNLNELNMLAALIGDMDDFEKEKLQAILMGNVMNIGEGTEALINLLYEDNFSAFNLVAANTPEELGAYYDRENNEVPEGVSFGDYGKMTIREEGGAFTPWGYVYCCYKELSPEYGGYVPDEYSVTDKALAILSSKAAERGAVEKLSVLERIRAAKTAPRDVKKQPPHRKNKGGPEL